METKVAETQLSEEERTMWEDMKAEYLRGRQIDPAVAEAAPPSEERSEP